jgi:predicted RNA-binding protein with PUA-like domain
VNHWLLKTEPSTYSYADLAREQVTTWDGVSNPTALRHLRAMRNGDQALVYHTGDEKAVVGVARIVSNPFPDPALKDPKRVVVDLAPVRALPKPIPLAAVKADPRFAQFALVRISRLSVMPVSPEEWKALLAL